MTIEFINQKLCDVEADLEVVLVVDKALFHPWVSDHETLSLQGFEGKAKQTALVVESRKLYIGVASLAHDHLRIAAAQVIKLLRTTKFASLKIGFYNDSCPAGSLKGLVEGFVLGDYAFDTYKTEKALQPIESITICAEEYQHSDKPLAIEALQKALKEALSVAAATNKARQIANTPPDDMTPRHLAAMADAIADDTGLSCIVHDESYLDEVGMGAFLAVSRASTHKPRLIHLTYTPSGESLGSVVFVGKGLCYDSGGLSLKPSDYMVTMKADKSGAAAVMAIMSALKELDLPLTVHGVIGAAENMIGGNAYKPDDVLVAKNGKTIEVRNTDAEGRLVLADCLCYIQDYLAHRDEPLDYIVDFATLTGACVVALGEYTTGVMGHSDEVKEMILKAAQSSGELAATLPFNPYLKELLKSEIADMSNISSSRYGGAITAALFLSEFINEENRDKWVHLDIAGPAYVEKAWGCNPHGASGAGVRLALKWLAQLARTKRGEAHHHA